jgi:hypothetical protein
VDETGEPTAAARGRVVKQPKTSVARKASGNVIALRSDAGARARRSDETANEYALRERHRLALEFVRELGTLLAGDVPDPDADAWGQPEEWRRWQALKTAEAARKHWITGGRQDDMPRRIRAVQDALELASCWKGPPVDPAFIRSEAARAAPELAALPIAEWESAIARWPAEKRGRGGNARTRPTPWYVVVFNLLKPHDLTSAKDAKAMKNAYDAAPKKRQRRRAK